MDPGPHGLTWTKQKTRNALLHMGTSVLFIGLGRATSSSGYLPGAKEGVTVLQWTFIPEDGGGGRGPQPMGYH